MKDHEIAQFVNQLTEVAKRYGQTQQLRDRISHVVLERLKPKSDAPVALAPTCIGKRCSCMTGPCLEALDNPQDVMWVTPLQRSQLQPLHPTSVEKTALSRVREKRMRLNLDLREQLQKIRTEEQEGLRRHLDDDTMYGDHSAP